HEHDLVCAGREPVRGQGGGRRLRHRQEARGPAHSRAPARLLPLEGRHGRVARRPGSAGHRRRLRDHPRLRLGPQCVRLPRIMRDPSPRGPFDQGLFLKHFNKGKAQYDEKRFEEAERELEEAYLLRPRDQKVLNLLGLVYFKQDKYEKAEEVYRKLAAESPDAHTLFYNLGLIYFKLSRMEEAETAFLKALELNRENPKINFYLG